MAPFASYGSDHVVLDTVPEVEPIAGIVLTFPVSAVDPTDQTESGPCSDNLSIRIGRRVYWQRKKDFGYLRYVPYDEYLSVGTVQ